MAVRDHEASGSGRIPFWVHQVVELLLALLLLVEGARTGEHTLVLVTLGGLLLVLVLCSDGALGAWPWIGRRVHRVLDFVVAALFAVSPFVLGLDGIIAIVILETAAAGMLWLALQTEWRSRTSRRAERPPTPAPAPAAPAAPEVPLARKLGTAMGKARDDGPRHLGRLVGRAQRAAKAAMAPDQPEEPAPSRPSPSEGPSDGASGHPDGPPAS